MIKEGIMKNRARQVAKREESDGQHPVISNGELANDDGPETKEESGLSNYNAAKVEGQPTVSLTKN